MQETAAVCAGESYTFPDGTTAEIFTNTSYTGKLTAASGCDSLITTAVEVIAVETAVSQDGNTLTANASNSSFQWIDCADNQAIANETNASFTPAVSGNYAVIVTSGNCQDTSACFNVVINGVSQLHLAPQMRISPNPAGNAIQVVLSHLDAPAMLSIRDTKGQEVLSKMIPAAPSCTVDISTLSPGMFFLILQTNDTVSILKFLKYQ
ncbi:MAG: T9SS type A sorting domain-containing protein [Saprospirales bacterium]|nr:T9SS type A sorting domain-containing protein [Saprospirales bacterium]